MALALQGIRVLEITDAIAGPFATMLLASVGAEVIRVESQRHLGFREGGGVGRGGGGPPPPQRPEDARFNSGLPVNPVFSRYNLNKLSVELNLVKPEGRDLFKQLLKVSDVVVDNLSFGVMRKWGLEYDALQQIKKDIIVVSMPSLGEGPHQEWTTWGMNLLSLTGFAYAWGHPDTPMEEKAANNTYGDYTAGVKTAACIMAALYHRARTGEGQHIEVSQNEATASLLGVSYLDYFVNNRVSPPLGNRHPRLAPHNSYPCKDDDRWCVIAVSTEDEWARFCRAIDSPKWAEDPKFRDMEARLKNVDELDKNIGTWTRQRTPHQVMKILQSFGVAAGAIQNSEDLYFDLQLRARGHMVEIDSGRGASITFDGPPLHLAQGQRAQTERAPGLGEHNDYVYNQLLGLSSLEIKRLTESQVIY